MNQSIRWRIVFALIPILILSACSVEEGQGGTAKISGTLAVNYCDETYSDILTVEPLRSEDVYIKYGDSKAESDRVRTSETGYFEFEYLFPGDYTIVYYTEDTVTGDDSEVLLTVNLSKGEHLDLDSLFAFEALDWDDGKASIVGQVNQVTYYSYPYAKDTVAAQEQEVYLRYNNGISYVERVRTDYDGYFEIPKLIPGTYEVYVYSENFASTPEELVVSKEIVITEFDNEVYDLGIFYINNL